MNLDNLQKEVGIWSWENFGPQQPHRLLLGLIRELGELSNAQLVGDKLIKEGRGDTNDENKMNAIGGITIILADFCEKSGLDFDLAVTLAWNAVRKRNWKQYPKDGMTE